jgi:hypothetical protein
MLARTHSDRVTKLTIVTMFAIVEIMSILLIPLQIQSLKVRNMAVPSDARAFQTQGGRKLTKKAPLTVLLSVGRQPPQDAVDLPSKHVDNARGMSLRLHRLAS